MRAVARLVAVAGRAMLPLLGITCAANLSGCALHASPGQPPLVGDIRIIGNRAVTSHDLIDRLALDKSGFRFIVTIGHANPFDPGMLPGERERLVRIYQAYGYYTARVLDVRTVVRGGRADVTFLVDEGPATHVHLLNIVGLDSLPAAEQLAIKRDLPINVGDVFAEADYESLKDAITTRLKSDGYWEAAVTGHAQVDAKARAADVQIVATPGTRFVIASVKVTGTSNVRLARVSDASALHSGDLLTPERLATAQTKVLAMGVFAQATAKPEALDRAHGRADVTIEVRESPFQSVDAGAGIELDQSRQLGRLRAVYTDRNVANDLQRIVAGGSIGYAFVPSVLQLLTSTAAHVAHGPIADIQLQFVQPRAWRLPFDASVGATYTKDLTPAFSYQRIGGQTGAIVYIEPVRGLTFAPSLHYDYYFGVTTGPPQPNIPGLPPTSFLASGCGPSLAGVVTPTCRIAYGEARLTWDLRDDPLEPHSGAYFSVATQYAVPVIADFHYFQFNPEARFYIPIGSRFTLAMRADYGLLQPIGSGRLPPGVARFFAGGATSDRAASAYELGPRDFLVLPVSGSGPPYTAGAPVPVGGDHLLLGSMEVRWLSPISNLAFAAFFDAGRLYLAEGNTTPNSDGGYQYAPGLGVRYRTPFGPLRLDFAFRISSESMLPVAVDTTNVNNPVSNKVPTTVFGTNGQPNYRIGTSCQPLAGQQSYQCYQEARFQFFITLGEPF